MRDVLARPAFAPALAAGLVVWMGLHVLEPSLPITWSYAHLGREPWLRPLAIALAVVLPLAVVRLRRRHEWDAPLRALSPGAVVATVVALAVLVWVLGLVGSSLPLPEGSQLYEARDLYEDKRFFVATVNDTTLRIPRWHLILWAFHHV